MPVIGLNKGNIGFLEKSGIDWDNAKSWESLAYGQGNIKVKVNMDPESWEPIPVYIIAKLHAGTTYKWNGIGMDDSVMIYNSSHSKVAESQMDEETWSGQFIEYTPSATALYFFKFTTMMGETEINMNLTSSNPPDINENAPVLYQNEKGLDVHGRIKRITIPSEANLNIDLNRGLVAFHPMTSELSSYGDHVAFDYQYSGTPQWETIQGMPYMDLTHDGYITMDICSSKFPSLNDERTFSTWVKIGDFNTDAYNKVFEFANYNGKYGFAGIKKETSKWTLHFLNDDYSSNTTASTNTWYHVTLVKKDEKWALYINGINIIEKDFSFEVKSSYMKVYVRLGILRNACLGPVRIYDRPLNIYEINALKNEFPIL